MQQMFHVRHLIPSHGGNHFTMSRVLSSLGATSSIPPTIAGSFKLFKHESMEPQSQLKFDDLYKESKRVKSRISALSTVIDTLRDISLPTELTINECNAEIQIVESSLSLRSKKLLE